MQEYDFVGVGAALIDLLTIENNDDGLSYKCCPGGSIAIFLAAAALQGSNCAYLGAVGKDTFGIEIKKALEKNKVDCTGMSMLEKYNTPCSVVTNSDNGERSFIFYRNETAYAHYLREHIRFDILEKAKVLHITSFALSAEKTYSSILKCIVYSKKNGSLISFDVNWRENVWNDDYETASYRIFKIISLTDILKVSEEELRIWGNKGDEGDKACAEKLLSMGPKLIVVTYGEKGSGYFSRNTHGFVATNQVAAIDTTGAGDCFFGVFMHEFLRRKIDLTNIRTESLAEAIRIGNIAAGYSVSIKGGIPSLPDRETMRILLAGGTV